MKFLVIFLVMFLSANAALDKQFLEKAMREITENANNCAKEAGATPDDVTDLINHKFPPATHEGKCVIHCMYTHYKMMQDGKLDKQAAISAFDELKKMDADLYGKVMQIIDACYDKGADLSDPCEVASAVATCSKNQAEAMGLSKESVMAAAY